MHAWRGMGLRPWGAGRSGLMHSPLRFRGPQRVTGTSGWGGPAHPAGPHSRNIEMSSTTSWSCLEMLISWVVLVTPSGTFICAAKPGTESPCFTMSCGRGSVRQVDVSTETHGAVRHLTVPAGSKASCFQPSRTKCGFCPLLPISPRFKIKSFWRECEVTVPRILLGHRREPLG